MFKLVYRTSFYTDLNNATDYIANELNNPVSAYNLVLEMESKIKRLEVFPLSCQTLETIKPFKTEYRVLHVSNYNIYYIVSETEQKVYIQNFLHETVDIEAVLS